MYKRIFAVPYFYYVVHVCMAISVAKGVAFLVANIFNCTPVEAFWKPAEARHCINIEGLLMGNAIAALLIDGIILCLPGPMVFRLQISLRRKFAILGMFLLGSL